MSVQINQVAVECQGPLDTHACVAFTTVVAKSSTLVHIRACVAGKALHDPRMRFRAPASQIASAMRQCVSPRVVLSACQHRMGTFTPVWNDEGCHVTQRCAGRQFYARTHGPFADALA